jgi:hypothetical protein
MTAFLTWEAGGTTVATEVDIIPSWTDTRESTVEDSPVEDGSTLTDHVSRLPPTLVVEAAISQTPVTGGQREALHVAIRKSLFQPGGLLALTSAIGSAIDAGLDALGFGDPPASGFVTTQFKGKTADPGNELHDKLIEAWQNAYLCKISLGVNRNAMRPYEGYVINNVTKTMTTEEGEKSSFSISLRHINIVQTQLVDLPIPSPLEAAAALAASLVLGDKPATIRDDAADKQRRESLLRGLVDSVGL